ncbi:MAG TPA: hypothetical protein VEK57_19065 [Thermoanaerobaculia bacterium]|nr:hypothetical protein [Thermoanaerobaculia bacterium]
MAIVLAVLYLGLIQLLMLDSSRQLAEARRFRARIVALTLAENAAELAATGITNPNRQMFQDSGDDALGKWEGKMQKGVTSSDGVTPFLITAQAEAAGLIKQKATVEVSGEIQGTAIRINYTNHSQ